MERRLVKSWDIDLAAAGKEPTSRGFAVAPTGRQELVAFDGRAGTVETFAYALILPDDETMPEDPASQRQHDAVVDFYGEEPAHAVQAGLMLSAWWMADEVRAASNFPFTAARRRLIHVATAAFILADPELRVRVDEWANRRWRSPSRTAAAQRTEEYRTALEFAADLVEEMRRAGARIFG